MHDIDLVMKSYIIVTIFSAIVLNAPFLAFMMLWLRRRVINPLQRLEKSVGDFAMKSHGSSDPGVLVMENRFKGCADRS